MKSFNPAVIPRNHQVEFVLEEANRGNLKPFEDFLYVLKEPYIDKEYLKPFQRAPELSERVYQTFCGT